MKKIREKILSLFMAFAMLLTSFSAFIPMTVHAASPEYINRLDLNLIINTPLTDAMTASEASYWYYTNLETDATNYRVEGSSYYYQCPSSAKCNIDDATIVNANNFVAGKFTYYERTIAPKPYEMNVANPDYDFDKDNLGSIEVYVNGAKNTDVIVGNYNSSWRSVRVYVPVTVTSSSVTTHTVTFDLDDGTIEGNDTYSANVANGNKVSKPTDPVKSGYRFDNWYANSSKTTLFDFANTTITAPTTIYAKYIRTYKLYVYTQTEQNGWGTVYLDGNPGTQGFFADEGTAHTATAVAASGYKFKEWQKGGVTVSTNANYSINNLNETTELFGIFEVDSSSHTQHTVTFINGNDSSTIGTVQVNDGEQVIRPATDPTMTNHTFVNWYSDASMTTLFDFATSITAPTPIYAKFNPNSYTISFDANGGTTSLGTVSIDHGSSFSINPTYSNQITPPANKEFSHWTINGTTYNNGDVYSNVTSSFTLVAQWKPVQHTVTFYDGGSELNSLTQQVNHGEKVARPSDPIKANHRFDGWYADASFTTPFDFNTEITSATPIYAKFIEQARIYYDVNGGTKVNLLDSELIDKSKVINRVDYENIFKDTSKVTPPTNKELDYLEINSTKWTDTTYIVNGDIFIKAIWKDIVVIPTQYTVTFINGTNNTTIGTATVNAGEKATRPTDPTAPTGYTFDNWYEDASMTTLFDFNTPITAHKPIYAKFNPNSTPQYSATVEDVDFGTVQVGYPDLTSIAKPIKVTNNGTEKLNIDANCITLSGDVDSFDTLFTSTSTIEPGKTAGGYWIKPKNGLGIGTYTAIATFKDKDNKVTETANITFKVVAAPITQYTITVTDGTSNKSSAEKNETITLTANTPVAGKEFDKWVVTSGTITLADETNSTTTFTMPEENVSVKATYKDIIVTPTYTIESGDGQSFTLGDTNDIVIKASGDLVKLTGIKVDGTTLVSSNYTTASGSTILTLLNSYLNTLSVENHTVTFVYNDGSVDATLKVLSSQNQSGDNTTTGDNTNTNDNNTSNDSTTNSTTTTGTTNNSGNPQTGDNIVFYIIMLGLSIIGLAGASVYINRKKLFNK